MSMTVCPKHHRWTRIERQDGTVDERDCPECPRPQRSALAALADAQAAQAKRLGYRDASTRYDERRT